MKNIFFVLILIVVSFATSAQGNYETVQNTDLYSFIDDLASLKIVDVNTAIKPYSRQAIAQWLLEADQKSNQLSKAQKARLKIFLKEFALEAGNQKQGLVELTKKSRNFAIHLLPPEVSYRDSSFSLLLRPIYGIRYFGSTNDNFYHSYGGAEFLGYYGKHWSGYASLRDNFQSLEPLARPLFLTLEQGGNYKIGVQGRSGADFSEMRGGLTYSWKWGSFSFIKDHIQWGDANHGSNILSGRTPSFPLVKLHLKPTKWLEFDYIHGWLISEEIDSTRSYYTSNGDYRAVFSQKYIAANMYSVRPFRNLWIGIGNSIIYSDVDVQPAYLIPFFFFKSLDHTLNKGIENQNSQMFLNISSRQIKHLHLFVSVFCDEFSIARLRDDRYNFMSYKGGLSLNGWPLKDLSLEGEFIHTNPITYKHRVPTTTFVSNKFNLGHYLTDNSEELYLAARYNLISTLQLKLSYTNAVHGNDYAYVFGGETDIDELPMMEEKSWSSQVVSLRADYLPFPNIRVFAEYSFSDVNGYDVDDHSAQYYLNRFSPTYLHGKTNTFMVGFGMGF